MGASGAKSKMNSPIYSPPPPVCSGVLMNGGAEFGRPGFGALPYFNSNLRRLYTCSPYNLNETYLRMFGS
jgi:hypothetical protein